ncbi:MAG: hypothetical protein FJ206_13715 [Gemmatimonadetes bacterium]|nr:hypothetical protein [Gemmatimonadota bacterium]
MIIRRSIRWLAAAALVAVPASAQTKGLELNLNGGLYVPTNDDGLQDAVRDATRRGSLLYGGRLTVWTGRALGVEFSGGYSPARVSVQSARGRFPRNTDLVYGSAKLMLNLTPGSKLIGLAIGGGAAYQRTGSLVRDADLAESEFGGVAGASLRISLGENVALRGDLEDLFYGGDFGLGNKFTHDLLLTAGLAIKL